MPFVAAAAAPPSLLAVSARVVSRPNLRGCLRHDVRAAAGAAAATVAAAVHQRSGRSSLSCLAWKERSALAGLLGCSLRRSAAVSRRAGTTAGFSLEANLQLKLSAGEDDPQIVLDDGGDLVFAWKPAKMSMIRPRGGGPSEMERWAISAGLVAAAAPKLGRGTAGVVLLARRE
ncbi:unnamed protein product, partial [Polarella glacialis]